MRWSEGEVYVSRFVVGKKDRSWSNANWFIREHGEQYVLLGKDAKGSWVVVDTFDLLEDAQDAADDLS